MNRLKIKPLLMTTAFLCSTMLGSSSCDHKEREISNSPHQRVSDTASVPQSSHLRTAAGKHALLIGIQDYSNTGFNSLKGPLNDITLTQGMLRERFGFRDQDFIILQDAQATHTGIEQAFLKLIQRVNSGDFVYLYYSGHGSQTADLNGDQPRSGKDQTWVSYGSRSSNEAHKDKYDVLDDEINGWLAALYAKTDQVVFVSDSCHSATVSRGFDLTRAVDKDDREHILGKLPYQKHQMEHGIRVGAARDYESAIDFPRADGKHYGLFTWYWVHNLQQAQTGDTWYTVFQRTYAQVTAERGIVQRPQMAGKSSQQVLGEGEFFQPQPLTVAVRPINDDWVELQAGFLSGVTKNSVYRFYQSQHPNPQSLPQLTITKVTGFVSYGKQEPKGAFQTGDLVVEESHAYHFTPIKVFLESDLPKQDKLLLQKIKSAFQRRLDRTHPLSAYTLTDDLSYAEWRLYLLRPKRENGQLIRASADAPLPKSFPEQPPELWVLTPEQRLLYPSLQIPFDNPTKGIQSLQKKLKKIARVREVKALLNKRRAFPVEVQAYLLTPDNTCSGWEEDCIEVEDDNLGWHRKEGPYSLREIEKRTFNQGEILTFSLYNQSRWSYYCYLINISPKGAIFAIFPDPKIDIPEDARIYAREKLELIDQAGLKAEFVGEETIKFITSRYPIDIRLLEQPNIKSGLNPLERMLVNVVHGTRGEPVSLRNDEWATGSVVFEVK